MVVSGRREDRIARGWPEGVDPDEEVGRFVDERFDENEQLLRKAERLGYKLVSEDEW